MAKTKIIDGWYIEGKKPKGWEKRGDGSFRLTISFKGPDGKNIIRKETFKTDVTAPSKLADVLAEERARFLSEAQNGKLRSGDSTTFEEYVRKCWIPQYASDRENLSVRTAQDTIKALETRIFPFIGSMKISEIRAMHVEEIISSMKNEGLKIGTIKRYFAMISGVMSWAFEHEVISENPCRRIRFRSSDTKKMQVFTKDQVEKFLRAIQMTYQRRTTKKETSGDWYEEAPVSTMYQVYFTIAVTSGLRRGEMCALTWRDVDLKEKKIIVSKSISKVEPDKTSMDKMKHSGLLLKGPKNASSYRTVPLSGLAVSLLRKWHVEETMISTSWDNGKEFDDNFIFVQMDNGLPLYPDSPSGKLKDIIRAYNEQKCETEEQRLPLLHLHELRHTCATQWILAGINIVIVARWLGHSKISTTTDIYGNHDDEAAARAAAEAVAGLYKIAV